MLKKTFSLAALFFILPILVCAQNFSGNTSDVAIAAPERSLKIGETLQYSVEWLGVPVGRITLYVDGIKKIDGNDCYHIVGRAKPNRVISKFYDVEYTVHTYIDVKNGYTVRFEKTRRMNNQVSYVEIDFDHKKNEALYRQSGSAPMWELSEVHDQVANSVPVTIKIFDGTQDLFSSLYYLRLLDLKQGQQRTINIYYEQRSWTLNAYIGVPFVRDIRHKGSFAVFEATLTSNLSKLVLGKSNMTVYLTADSRRIPVEFKFGTSLGTIRGIIQNMPD